MEGDTPAFLSLIPNGLNTPEHPDFGGWGGRYELYKPAPLKDASQKVDRGIPITPEARRIWTNAVDAYRPAVDIAHGRPIKAGDRSFSSFQATLRRWRRDFQNAMVARMTWSTVAFEQANHPPVRKSGTPERMTVRSGETISFYASASTDPDGDSLSFYWFNHPEAGIWKQPIAMNGAENVYRASATAPDVKRPETARFILSVTDKGTPALTRYKRVIVTIRTIALGSGITLRQPAR